MTTYEYDDADRMPSGDAVALAHLSDAIDLLAKMQRDEDAAEKALKVATAKRVKMEQEILPSIMNELGLTRADSKSSGARAQLVTKLRCSLAESNERRGEALDWLEANGHGDLIHNEVVVTLPKEYAAVAPKLEAALPKWGGWRSGMAVHRLRNANTAQVTVCLNELREKQVLVPLELFKGFDQTFVKITLPKDK